MSRCIVAIDIGNTSSKVALYKFGRLVHFKHIGNSDIPKYVFKTIKSGGDDQLDVILCSVVPINTLKLIKSMKNKKCINLIRLGTNIKINIRHKYNNYNSLGIDRKLNAYGAIRMYRLPILILSYGTALTADYVDSGGVFRGGLIIPGPEISYKALAAKGALLPKKPHFPSVAKSFPGRDTRSCLESGILQGYGAMTEGLIQRFKAKYGPKLRVLATGGFATTIANYAKGIDIIDPLHTIKSMMALWRDHRKNTGSRAER